MLLKSGLERTDSVESEVAGGVEGSEVRIRGGRTETRIYQREE